MLPLEGSAEVTVDGESFTLQGRDGVFAAQTDFVYVPRDARVEITGEGRVALPSSRAGTGWSHATSRPSASRSSCAAPGR